MERDVQLSRSLFLSGIVIMAYDHILTLGPEIRHVWPTRRSFPSAWFLCLRYFSFCSNIVVALDTFVDFGPKLVPTRFNSADVRERIHSLVVPLTNYRCSVLDILVGFLILAQEIMIAVTICLRIYAMYALSKRLVVFMACAVMITVGVSAYAIVPTGKAPTVSVHAPGCYVPDSRVQELHLIGAWGAQLGGDVIAISLILYRAYTHGQGTTAVPGSLWGVLIRDGILYFVQVLISLANVANILVFYFGDIYTSTSLTWFTSAISATMMLRLMINLHVAAAPSRGDVTGSTKGRGEGCGG
ncbi:hypothetical protein FB45DRAFT_1033027 [Roridomyces roridus]|uniref:DUF6533 domain-containing protein n=1 Tax=Roridomyces roridus TaxID=1738132 RepID=A0AAD7BGW4_9AGAR|nr:hypothetical protein FB45DRAFT_1033027 [Roridomyces roridus]